MAGVLALTDETVAALRGASIADCLKWALQARETTRGDKQQPASGADAVIGLGNPASAVLFALHPFGRLLVSDADPSDPAAWGVVGYEILARQRGGGDAFPFPLYAKMSRQERLEWTLRCAELSAFLKTRGVMAKFNLQACDQLALGDKLEGAGLGWEDLHYELAEFAESPASAEGAIGLPPTKAAALDAALLEVCVAASLDDCGEGAADTARGYDTVLKLAVEQAARLASGALAQRAFHTIKIDSVPAFAAYKGTHPNPRAPPPTPEVCATAATELSAFVQALWEVDSALHIIVEGSPLTTQELQRVPALPPHDNRVSFQGCHLHAETVLVAYA